MRLALGQGLTSNVRTVLEQFLANTPLNILTPCSNTLLREVLGLSWANTLLRGVLEQSNVWTYPVMSPDMSYPDMSRYVQTCPLHLVSESTEIV